MAKHSDDKYNDRYERVDIRGTPGLYSDHHVDTDGLPSGLKSYNIDGGATIIAPSLETYSGNTPGIRDQISFSGESCSVSEFMKKHLD